MMKRFRGFSTISPWLAHSDDNNRRITEYKKEHDEAAIDISAYVSNPINAYLLTKRLTSDWKIIEQAMTNDIGNGSYYILLLKFFCNYYDFDTNNRQHRKLAPIGRRARACRARRIQ